MTGTRQRRYSLLLALAGLSLWWERAWPRLWPAATLLGAFTAIALFDLPSRLPPWLHLTILVGVGGMLAGLVIRAVRAIEPVDRRRARHRLEQDSRLTHRPLAALEDRLAAGAGDPLAQRLWQRHLAHSRQALDNLSLRLPSPQLARWEPWGLRAGVLLLLVIGLAAAGHDAGPRVVRALLPALGTPDQTVTVDIWINPPAYTGRPPIYFRGEHVARSAGNTPKGRTESVSPVPVPEGSTFLARVQGLSRPPSLKVGDALHSFRRLEGGNGAPAVFSAEGSVGAGDAVTVHASRREIARWPVAVIPDQPPQVTFAAPPAAVANGLVELSHRAADDYAVTAVSAIILPVAPAAIEEAEAVRRVPLPLSATGIASVSGQRVVDLSADVLAGEMVTVTLEAIDSAGQVGRSEPVEMRLPERAFHHPLARRIIAERKRLAAADGPTQRSTVADALAALTADPDHLDGDMVVFLALAVASSRLRHDRDAAASESVRAILWEAALRLEEGDVPAAERQVQAARQALRDALRDNAPAAEIERLMDALEEALSRYMAVVASESARRDGMEAGLEIGDDPFFNTTDLNELLDLTRRFARAGARDSAERMLDELQRILEGIRAGLEQDDLRRELRAARRLVNSLRDLAEQQRRLLDRVLEAGGLDPDGQGDEPEGDPVELARNQQALRQTLGQLMLDADGLLGGIPSPLGAADRAMSGAAQALRGSQPGPALGAMTEAVDALNRALNELGETFASRFGGTMGGLGFGQGGFDGGVGNAFGRQQGSGRGGFGAGDVVIPDEAPLRRAQEIMEELRRRAGDRARPPSERDYIERLLRWF